MDQVYDIPAEAKLTIQQSGQKEEHQNQKWQTIKTISNSIDSIVSEAAKFVPVGQFEVTEVHVFDGPLANDLLDTVLCQVVVKDACCFEVVQ